MRYSEAAKSELRYNEGSLYMYVVVCTDLPSKQPQRQVGVGRVTSGSLGGEMVSTLGQNAMEMS